MKRLIGISASGGVAVGPLYRYSNTALLAEPVIALDADAELRRFETARELAIETLGELRKKACARIGPEDSLIFEIHQMMLNDEVYTDSINQLIKGAHYTAEYAVQQAGAELVRIFAVMSDAYMRERGADMADISNRIIRLLRGEVPILSMPEERAVFAAWRLLPSETLQLGQEQALAFVTSAGSRLSHSAILARNLGIPAVIGLGSQLDGLRNGDPVLVDGTGGVVISDPDEEALAWYGLCAVV